MWLWPGPVGLLLQKPRVHLHPGLPAALWHPLRQLPGLHHRRGHLSSGPHLSPKVLRVQLVQEAFPHWRQGDFQWEGMRVSDVLPVHDQQ
ncbi:hypothetical protein MC885_002409 [Smutsia gigantea]|nr:hypothetical protein MC885_002409 [Smutsia gigantea]